MGRDHRGRLIALAMSWREGVIVGLAVPITYSLTLLFNYLLGYTINRVTLFALILALGPAGGRPDRRRGEHLPAPGHAALPAPAGHRRWR